MGIVTGLSATDTARHSWRQRQPRASHHPPPPLELTTSQLFSTAVSARPRNDTMRITTVLSALCAAAAVRADPRTAQIYIQPIDSSSSSSSVHPPAPLAEISYDTVALSASSMVSYDAPEIPDEASLVRIGLYDAKSRSWISGTTVASAENFAKGYSPNIVVTVDAATPARAGGDVVSVACKGVAIDAGQTRDFGPQVVVIPQSRGAQPTLNKPVVLSREGKTVEPEQEKTFLQKYESPPFPLSPYAANLRYWWMIAIAVFLAMSGGGAEK
ncbi:cyclin-dependent protein kinase regulator pho80 [Purpureocillium lavendulum]|uniref:Cyclin-dependent protein kinase regulator pho80 n=1 Tax=Purpureocillium lavendulum TaxID=1247861 RepID=A0AB34FJA3_9HYPO|nr:cyclin-dependent protein kinase regulator pho80 [Purpureocillium lavendulum]